MPSRRSVLRSLCGTTAGLVAAGCLDSTTPQTTVGKIVVGNYQSQETTLQLLVYCDDRPVVWRTYQLDPLDDDSGDAPDGAVIENLPPEHANCQVHTRLNDGEDDATLDLRDLDADCTMLHVYAEAEGGVDIYYADHCR